MPTVRDTSISIAKGLAIIAVVIGHSGAPGNLSYLMYAFHMPLFFITAGYFFNLRYLGQEGTFVRRRFKGLYVPFVKWSLVFLLLYNLWFKLGVMNEQYGNSGGGLLHPYSFHALLQNAVSICANMSGYDVCLGGAFWFFRALLVASIAFLFYYKFLTRFKLSAEWTTLLVCLTALSAAILLTAFRLRVTGLPQGGYRDLMGLFYFGLGFLYRNRGHLLKRGKWYVYTIVCAAILAAWCRWRLPVGMPFTAAGTSAILLSLPPAIAGFLLIHRLSAWIDRHDTRLRQFLVYCGDNTLYVFIFHFAVFKLVNLLKIMWYGMDYSRMGYYPVIHEHTDDWFWLVYTLAGTALPLLWIYGYRKLKSCLRTCKNAGPNRCTSL